MTDTEDWQRALLGHGKALTQLKVWAERLHRSQKYAAVVFSADLRQAWVEMAELLTECARLDARGPRGKAKWGRPGFWKSVEGLHLMEAVEEVRAKKHYGIARALRLVIKTDPRFKDLCRTPDRALQARYQEAVKHWSFLRGSYREERAAMNVRLLAAAERLTTAFNRWKASQP